MVLLTLRSVVHYWRSNLVVATAVAIATAVIGGALVTGDSVRASLRQMTMSRLGAVTHVLNSPRFVQEGLSGRMAGSLRTLPDATQDHQQPRGPEIAAPALLMTGSVELKSSADDIRRAAGATVLGLKPDDWHILDVADQKPPSDSGVVLGARTALELSARVGDTVSIWIELPSSIPRDTLLGERDNTTAELAVTVEGILPESAGASRFSLQPAQQLPYNAFVSLSAMQRRLGLEDQPASRRNPVAKPGRINTILFAEEHPIASERLRSASAIQHVVEDDLTVTKRLQTDLKSHLAPADIGLRIRSMDSRGYLSAESDSMILENPIADAIQQSATRIGLESSPVLVYLINEFSSADRTDPNSRYSMYSIVAGVDFHSHTPLGPFAAAAGESTPELGPGDIVLSDWLANDLNAAVGSVVNARWHEVGSHGDLPETHQSFTVRGILKAEDPVSIDDGLTPFVDGVTNVDSFSDWDQPFRMEMERITDRDDEYWEQRKATPKAFVSLETAEKLWSSRFGRFTSVRLAYDGKPMTPESLASMKDRIAEDAVRSMNPETVGLFVRPIRAEGLRASVGANDFTQLFLAFSFFLILSAILLSALMFQLSVQQRAAQIGLMEAVGFTAERARRFFVVEGLSVAMLGAVLGVFSGVAAARGLIYGLTTWWVGAIGTRFLILDLQPARLMTAAGISVILAGGVIWNAVRSTSQRSPRELLQGQGPDDSLSLKPGRWSRVLTALLRGSIAAAICLPIAVMTNVLPAAEAFGGMSWRVVGFFVAGFAWLTSGLLLLRHMLVRRAGGEVEGSGVASLSGLSLANAARNSQRSVLTAALIAFATFVIVAVGAGRRNPVSEAPDQNSGNGGFTLVAESSLPILFDLNTAAGRASLGLGTTAENTLPDGTTVFSFRMRPGQDASCLNLFQATVPTLLGATPGFIQRGGFRFADTPAGADGNAWMKLNATMSSAPEDNRLPRIPVIGDMNTLQFSLKKKIGDVIPFPDDRSPTHELEVVGMLDSSIFQGVLVMTEDNLKKLAPELSGSRYFLIETPRSARNDTVSERDRVAGILETALQPYGLDTIPVAQRLADFLAVQNTYLSTFQMLGGLGLVVGTIGLAVVMMRNVIERRQEIALLRSLGFPGKRIVWLIASENTLLLFWGILKCTISALIAMLPHLLSTGADVPWPRLILTLVFVLLVGTLAVIFPVRTAMKVSVREVLTGI
ncbi:MAG: ABC transporter permease [Planctomycetota bacterium]